MNSPTLFQEILLSFEQQPWKPISENEIYNLIQKQIPEEYRELSNHEKAELIAFRFLETTMDKNTRSTFYFEPFTIRKNETGEIIEFPSRSMVTADSIAYWSARLDQTKHPVLAARYAGLVYDFNFYATGKNPSFLTAKKYVESLLSIIEQKLYNVPIYAVSKAERALEVSLTLNNSDLIRHCKNTILKLEKEIDTPDKPGLWGFSFDLLVDTKRALLTEAEEGEIVKGLEERFDNMLMVDSWCAECAAERLAKYYFNRKQKTNLKNVINKLESSYLNATAGLSALHRADYTDKLYQWCKKFQLNKEATTFLKNLRELNKKTDHEMKSVFGEISLSKETIDNYVNQILKGNKSEKIFIRIIEAFTPKIEQSKKKLIQLSKVNPLKYIFSQELADKKGRRIAKIGPITEDIEGHLIRHLSNTIRIDTVLIHYVFKEAINRQILTIHQLVKFLAKSCIIEKNRIFILQKAFDAYFSEDYIVATHLLIPQFEEAIRNLMEINGGNVMIQKGDAFNLKTLDHLLNDEIITDVFGEDKSFYFRILFTDRRGWNIRNNVAHGLLESEELLNKQNIDRIIHATLCLGMVRLKGDMNSEIQGT